MSFHYGHSQTCYQATLTNSTPCYGECEPFEVYGEYHQDILSHLVKMEQNTKCNPDMMSIQPELELRMRPYLLDFLLESHLGLQLSKQTLYLAVNLVDRYCSKRVVYKRHYQLVGCTALWIASKYHDIKSRVPSIDELREISCFAYEAHMFRQMELHILTTLEWIVGYPTVDLFLDIYLDDQNEYTRIVRNIALYLCENAMYHHELLKFTPSMISKCAIQLSQFLFTQISPPSYAHSRDEVMCLSLLAQYSTQPTACLERKYMSPKFSNAAYYVQQYKELDVPVVSKESEMAAGEILTQRYGLIDYLTPPPTDSENEVSDEDDYMEDSDYESPTEWFKCQCDECKYEFDDGPEEYYEFAKGEDDSEDEENTDSHGWYQYGNDRFDAEDEKEYDSVKHEETAGSMTDTWGNERVNSWYEHIKSEGQSY